MTPDDTPPTDMTVDKSVSTQPDSKSNLNEPPPSFVKLAMRNMVKKGGKSLYHFSLSAIALIALFVGLSYLTKP